MKSFLKTLLHNCRQALAVTIVMFATLAMTTLSAVADHIYEGESFYGGWELFSSAQGDITLGDGDGSGLELYSTPGWCIRRGSSYSTMRSYIQSNNGWVEWYIDEICTQGHVRICVYDAWGNVACSTFIERGWVPF